MIGVDCFNIIKALVVRGVLALHATLTVWRVTENLHDQMYWLLSCLMVPFVIEGLYSIIRRKGKEYLWFSPCFFFYLCGTLPPIWLLELDKSKQVRQDDAKNESAIVEVSNATNTISVVPVPISLNPNMWTIVIEEMLLYLLVIGRWVLPRGAVTREQLSELLFAFIGIAADVMEFFSLFGEKDVRRNKVLGYCLLGIWSLSILQFTMAVTVTQQPKRGRKITTVKSLEAQKSEPDEKEKLSSELGAIFISMAMQDVPFLTLRLYTIIKYNLINYSLIFFTSKNVLVISLLFYKIAVILQKRYCPEYVDEEDSGGEVKIRYRGGKEDPDRKESSASKYALDYEYAGFTPTKPNRSGPGGSPRMDSSGDLKQRNVSKQPNINVSPSTPQQKKKMNLEINAPPNGQALSPGKEDPQRAKVKDSGHSPAGSVGSASGASPAMSKSSSRPRSSDHGSLSPASPQGSSEQEGQMTEPVIYTPPTQSAQPGDPEFKPYVSVVKIGD